MSILYNINNVIEWVIYYILSIVLGVDNCTMEEHNVYVIEDMKYIVRG